jgi:hypothetical protein
MDFMYYIKWRIRPTVLITGLSNYRTREAAERQVAYWQRIFAANVYYIERR